MERQPAGPFGGSSIQECPNCPFVLQGLSWQQGTRPRPLPSVFYVPAEQHDAAGGLSGQPVGPTCPALC